ncbi:MAG: hypothetical protein ACI9HJ_001635, partial [Ulvibacter sp.]
PRRSGKKLKHIINKINPRSSGIFFNQNPIK